MAKKESQRKLKKMYANLSAYAGALSGGVDGVKRRNTNGHHGKKRQAELNSRKVEERL